MKNWLAAATMLLLSFALLAPAASAFEGGGRKPSEAPLIVFGQQYSAQLNNHKADANYGSYEEVAFWRLPPVSSHDLIVVNWHGIPYTRPGYNGFPVCMSLAQGLDDYNWGAIYSHLPGCDSDGPAYSLAGSGTAQTAITVQETNAGSSYLEFFAYSGENEPSRFETYPYDFSVEAPRHYLGIAFAPVTQLSTNSTVGAAVTMADGKPAPDGLVFNLNATWGGGGTANYSAYTAGGGLSFPLALPETAAGKKVTLVASRPADSGYQAATTTKLSVQVDKATPPPPSACVLAQRHLRAVGRQFARVSRHAQQARGRARRGYLRQKRRVRRNLQRAHTQAESACRPL